MEKEKDELLNPEDFEDEAESKDDGKSNEEETSKNQASTENNSNEVADSDEKKNEEVKKKNAEYAKKRREQEEAERKKREAELRAEIEKEVKLGMYKKNPYTNEPIVDEEDLKQFEIQKQLDDEGKDPINDYPKRVAELNRKARLEEQKKLDKEKKEKENLTKDLMDFKEKYPKVDLRELADNSDFIKFSEGKTGRWTTAEIYEAFNKEQEMKQLKTKKQELDDEASQKANNITKTPSANGAKTPPKDNIDNLTTPDEVREYLKNKYH